jgi:outer membrane protein TolC
MPPMQPYRRRTDGAAPLLALALVLAAVPAVAQADDQPAQDGEALKKALQARYDAAQRVYNARMQQFQAGSIGTDVLFAAQKQLLQAELDLRDKKDDRVTVCQKNVDRAAEARKIADLQHQAGKLSMADYLQADYELQDAKVLLEREKMK